MFRLKVKMKNSWRDPIEFAGDYTAVVELLDKMVNTSSFGDLECTISKIDEEDGGDDE